MVAKEARSGSAAPPAEQAAHPAAYDPVFLLPFTLQVCTFFGGKPNTQPACPQPNEHDACLASDHSQYLQACFLLVQVIRDRLMTCLEVASSGLLAVLLRGLACRNAAMRSCAYEALALYGEALEASNFRLALSLLILCHEITTDAAVQGVIIINQSLEHYGNPLHAGRRRSCRF